MKGSVYIAVTVDGFIADAAGGVGFLDEFPSSDGDDMGFGDFLASIDAVIMGRASFEKVLSFGRDMWAYGEKAVTVWTRRPDDLEIPEHLRGTVSASSLSPKELFSELEKKGHRHAYIDGGLTVRSFLEEDLVDEMQLTRVPLLLGRGIPLFGSGMERRIKLEHAKTQAYPNGMVTSCYRVITAAR
jgi:dihydrofolate reductase